MTAPGDICRASRLDGTYPRPQLVRPASTDLTGVWDFVFDDDDAGRDEGWPVGGGHFDRTIQVPYPPESKASGIGDTGFHPVVWYRRILTTEHLTAAGLNGEDARVLLHFGAVDYRADVWLDGHYLGHHEGGQTPFSFDITNQLGLGGAGDEPHPGWALVVRAEDDPLDVTQPRGKQDWQLEPHGIWYHRTTGIWQPVWLEAVPALHITDLAWTTDVPAGTVALDLELNRRPRRPVSAQVTLSFDGEVVAQCQTRITDPRSRTVITLPRQANGQAYEALLWSPETPRLLDATIELLGADGATRDAVGSYLGLRSVSWADGHVLLNDRPCYLRAVLAQGYWPETLLAAPSGDALRAEVQLVKDLGFNAARIHEKVEDPRFLYWADRLGLLIWGESASAYEFSPTAVRRMTREWADAIHRDRSHPCIITWVPLNESWGIQHVAHDPAQLAYTRSLYELTKALDPTRLVISNDGWEHAESDVWTIHDYSVTRTELTANYPDRATAVERMAGIGPLGRRMQLSTTVDRGQPIIVSEFGGVSFAPDDPDLAWGYITAAAADDFDQALSELFTGLQSSPALAGFCYTQLTDTLQEANGLTDTQRRPKLPAARIRSIVLGEGVDISSHRRPRKAVEQSHRLVSERAQAFDASTDAQPPTPRE